MAEQNKTPNPEVTKPLPTVEVVLADLNKDASEVDLRLLTQEITDITEQEKLDQIRLWATDQHTAAGQNIKELQEQATLIPAIAKSLEVAIKQLQALETQLNEVITATGLRSGELKIRAPFQAQELFDGFEVAKTTGDFTLWNLAVEKMAIMVEKRVRENLGTEAPAATREADAPQTPTEGEAGKPKNTETTKTEETDPEKEFADALKTLEEFAEKYPDHGWIDTVRERLKWIRTFRNGNWVPAFIKDRWVIRYAKKLQKEEALIQERERFQKITEALAKGKIEKLQILIEGAPQKDGKVDLEGLKKKKDRFDDLTAHLVFMSDILHAIRRPTWVTDEKVQEFVRYPKLIYVREVAQDNRQLVEEYYTRKSILDMVKTNFPDLFIEGAADDTEAAKPKKVEPAAPVEPAGTGDGESRPSSAPLPPKKETTPIQEVPMNTAELLQAFGLTQQQLEDAEKAGDAANYAQDDLEHLVTTARYTDSDITLIVLPALANKSQEALKLLTQLAKKGKKA